MSDRETSQSVSRSRSRERSKHSSTRSRSRTKSKSRSRSKRHYSRSRSPQRRNSRSRSRSYGKRYSRSRSRSRSYDRRRSSKHDRDREYGGGGRGYDDYYEKRSSYRGGGRDSYRDRDYRDYGRSHSRSPMSRRRRHLGDRDNPETSRCIGVFGLSLRTQERELRERFERYGPIDDLQIVYDHQTGKSRGFGFIYYRDLEDAVEAKESAPGSEIDGHKIRCDYSITKRAHTPTPGVYLGRPSDSGYRVRRSRSPYKSSRRRSRSYSRERSYTPRRY